MFCNPDTPWCWYVHCLIENEQLHLVKSATPFMTQVKESNEQVIFKL
nr:Hypothetical protein [Raoultella ornithinolytica]UMW96397.1 hypothetical protein [Raoultella ornithinolytica]URZ94407.1 Hypothetical protein [Raoultella ornithinolytica]UWX38117.1 hypothetical protein KJK04_p0565 [Klebsiella quasipneumoniae]UWX38452.1 hypothetical protein KK467_p0720 [Klebsiella pneumoniae]